MLLQISIVILGIVLQATGAIYMAIQPNGKYRNVSTYLIVFGAMLLVKIGMVWLAIAIFAIQFSYFLYQRNQNDPKINSKA